MCIRDRRGRVRRNRSGEISIQFEYKYRIGTAHRTAKIEQWPQKSLAEIRAIYREIKTNRAKGIDPIEARKANKLKSRLEQARQADHNRQEIQRLAAEAASQRTLSKAISRWEEQELSRRKDNGQEAMRAIRKDVLPMLGEIALIDIRRSMLLEVLDPVSYTHLTLPTILLV